MRVSICCITYNHEKFIKETFEGFFLQEFNDYEIVISDDCSTDGTINILKEYKSKYPDRIRLLLNERNIGVMPNFTQALLACQGDYIALCEGDDYWIDPLKLKKQVDILDRHSQYSMAFSNRIIVDSMSKQIGISNYSKEIYNITDIVNGFIPATQTIIFRRNKELGNFFSFQGEKYSGDRILSFYCSLFGNIFRMQEATAAYRNSGSGVWSQYSMIEKLKLKEKHLFEFQEKIGLKIDEPLFAFNAFENFIELIIIGIKNPSNFLNKKFLKILSGIWKKYRFLNRLKILQIVLSTKIKQKLNRIIR